MAPQPWSTSLSRKEVTAQHSWSSYLVAVSEEVLQPKLVV